MDIKPSQNTAAQTSPNTKAAPGPNTSRATPTAPIVALSSLALEANKVYSAQVLSRYSAPPTQNQVAQAQQAPRPSQATPSQPAQQVATQTQIAPPQPAQQQAAQANTQSQSTQPQAAQQAAGQNKVGADTPARANVPAKQDVSAPNADTRTAKRNTDKAQAPAEQWLIRLQGKNVLVSSDQALKVGQRLDLRLTQDTQGEPQLRFNFSKESETAALKGNKLNAEQLNPTQRNNASLLPPLPSAVQSRVLIRAISQLISQQVPLDIGLRELSKRAGSPLNIPASNTHSALTSLEQSFDAVVAARNQNKEQVLAQQLLQVLKPALIDTTKLSDIASSPQLKSASTNPSTSNNSNNALSQEALKLIKAAVQQSGFNMESALAGDRTAQESLARFSVALSALLAPNSQLAPEQSNKLLSQLGQITAALNQSTGQAHANNATGAGVSAQDSSALAAGRALPQKLMQSLQQAFAQLSQQASQQSKQALSTSSASSPAQATARQQTAAQQPTTQQSKAATSTNVGANAPAFVPQQNLKAALLSVIGALSAQTQGDEVTEGKAVSAAMSHSATLKSPFEFPSVQQLFAQQFGQQLALQQNSAKADAILADQQLSTGQMLKLVAGMLNRLQFNQLNSLYQSQPGNAEGNSQTWMFEIPVQHAQAQLSTWQVRIDQKEQQHQSSTEKEQKKKTLEWKLSLSFDLEQLGPLYVQLALQPPRVSPMIWCQKTETLALLEAERSNLTQQLSALGLEVDPIHCHRGQPISAPKPVARGFVDLKA